MAGIKNSAAITVRALESPEDFRGCVRLQKEIWGFSDEDSLPVRLFIMARRIGGQIFGAFEGDELIGFCVALPGLMGVAPGNGLIMMPPVSVCHHVSTMGHRALPMML